MHDTHHGHEHGHHHGHRHEHANDGEALSDIGKLRKMAEHWIGHSEEHARSYRLWASRAKEAGQNEPAEILEKIAGETMEQNERFKKIIHLLDSAGQK